MPDLRIKPDRETYDLLVKRADEWRRPVAWQAEVLLRQAVGLPFPPEPADQPKESGEPEPVATS